MSTLFLSSYYVSRFLLFGKRGQETIKTREIYRVYNCSFSVLENIQSLRICFQLVSTLPPLDSLSLYLELVNSPNFFRTLMKFFHLHANWVHGSEEFWGIKAITKPRNCIYLCGQLFSGIAKINAREMQSPNFREIVRTEIY